MTLAGTPFVRPASSADVAAVARLEHRCLGDDAWSPALVEQGIAAALPTVSYLVVEVGGRVLGHAVASVAGDDAELQRIAVDPSYRRRGLATALLDAVEALAARGGATRLLLEVREDNAAALALYASRGFADWGRRPAYYRDGAAAALLGKKVGHRGSTAPEAEPAGDQRPPGAAG